ncbi:MAG: hypothetical protein ABL936_19525 [Aestuariivirga sp.]
MKESNVQKLYQERLRPEGLAALQSLVGQINFHFYSPNIRVLSSHCECWELSIRTSNGKRFSPSFVGISFDGRWTPKLDLPYCVFEIEIENRPRIAGYEPTSGGGGSFSGPFGEWHYDSKSLIEKIDIFNLRSIPAQMKFNAGLLEFAEATDFDSILAFRMSDGGTIAIEQSHGSPIFVIQRIPAGSHLELEDGFQLRTTLTNRENQGELTWQ